MDITGKRIAERRKHLGITQQEFAKKVGYSTPSAIAKIETGVNNLSQSKLQLFASALDTSPMYLMGMTDDPKPIEAKKENAPTSERDRSINLIIKLFEQLTPEQKLDVLNYVSDMIDHH